MANILVCLSLCMWWTFWTDLWLSLCFSRLHELMFHIMLDVDGNILQVYYTRMKCNVSFSQRSVSTLFRWGGYFSCLCKKFILTYNGTKIIKISQDIPELWLQMHCHLFRITMYKCVRSICNIQGLYSNLSSSLVSRPYDTYEVPAQPYPLIVQPRTPRWPISCMICLWKTTVTRQI